MIQKTLNVRTESRENKKGWTWHVGSYGWRTEEDLRKTVCWTTPQSRRDTRQSQYARLSLMSSMQWLMRYFLLNLGEGESFSCFEHRVSVCGHYPPPAYIVRLLYGLEKDFTIVKAHHTGRVLTYRCVRIVLYC